MKKILYVLTTISVIMTNTSFAQATPEHISSIKFNDVELAEAVPANQLEKITGKTYSKVVKEYSECSTNYEYSTTLNNGNSEVDQEI